MTISAILLIAAFVAFLVAAFGVAVGKLNLIAVGLALWVLAEVLGGMKL